MILAQNLETTNAGELILGRETVSPGLMSDKHFDRCRLVEACVS